MNITLVGKADGSAERLSGRDPIVLRAPTVVRMPFGPEAVARFDKVGADLVLLLRDGTRIVVENFFRAFEGGGRSDLVFVDAADVTWWAQYDEPWGAFDIAEIETAGAAAAGAPPGAGLLGGLLGALGAAGAAVAGGGGSRSDPVPPALVPSAADDSAAVLEAGASTGSLSASGNLFDNDGPDAAGFRVTELTMGGRSVQLGVPVRTTYGEVTVNSDGTYDYVLDDDRAATVALAEGQNATEIISYAVANRSGETSVARLVVTLTGANDAPTIAGVDAGAVSEGGPSTRTGRLTVEDPDAGDAHAWAIAAGEAGRYGTFSIDASGVWTYVLDDALPAVQALGAGDALIDTIDVTVTDRSGATDTRTVTVMIDGANDAPVASGDVSFTPAGTAVVRDVRRNDSDADKGESADLAVTRVAGRTIAPGIPVALAHGTVSIDSDGKLTFAPDAGFAGVVAIPYVVNDRSGAADATAKATWTVTVDPLPGIALSDDAGPAGTPDDVLSALDELSAVAVRGQVPGGGTLLSVVVSDGTDTVAIPVGDIAEGSDGAFSTVADLNGLNDGTLTVTMRTEDRTGTPATVTDDILKDTRTVVAIDPLTVRGGEVPTLIGTGGPGDRVSLTIDGGEETTITVRSDGTWRHVPPAPLADAEVTISVAAIDGYGNTASAERAVISAIVRDQVPAAPEDILVDEANLQGGTSPAAAGAAATSTIVLEPGDAAVAEVEIAGATITAARLEAADAAPIGPIATTHGTVTVTGFDAGTGTLTFDYALSGAAGGHDAAGADILRETIAVAATDDDGDRRETELVVAVRDDVPAVAVNGAFEGAVTASDASLGADPSTSFAGLFDVDGGADGAAVTYALSLASSASGLVDGATGEAVMLVLEDGAVVGRVGGAGPEAGAVAFTASVDASTGEVTLDQSRELDHGAGGPIRVADAAVRLAATATDGDGDVAARAVDIGARLRFADDAPLAVVEGGAALGTSAGDANLLVGDGDGAGPSGGRVHRVTYADAAGTQQVATIAASASGTGPLAARFGTLEVDADGTWSFAPKATVSNPGGAGVDAGFAYDLVDADGKVHGAAAQPITVTDTAPIAADDATRTVAEGAAAISGDVTGNDTDSADVPMTVASFSHADAAGDARTVAFDPAKTTATVATPTGSLTVNADGTWRFAPADLDHDAAGANPDGGSFRYVLVDGDGTVSAAADQPITLSDTDPDPGGATLTLDEDDLPGAGSDGAGGADPSATRSLGLTRGADPISDVAFTQATIDALPALTSDGTEVTYALAADGHRLTASAGGATVFTVVLDNPGDPSGSAQAVTGTLSAPLDQAGASTALTLPYELRDADSVVSGTVSLTLVDDAPAAPQDDAAVTVEEGGSAAGSASGGANLLSNDILGADGGRVSGIGYTDAAGDPAATTIAAGGAQTVATRHGTLTAASDGTWTYTPSGSADHASGNDTELSDDFTYTVADGDGDAGSAPATQPIAVTDTVPIVGTPTDAAVDEADLAKGSAPDAAALTQTGTLDVTAGADGVAATITSTPTGITSGGLPLQYAVAADGRSVEAFAGGDRVFTLTLTDPATAGAGYSFTLEGPLDHGGNASLDLDFGFRVTDGDADTADGSFTVAVTDDAAPAAIARTIQEDGSFTSNISADATPANTTIRQDGADIPGTPNGDGSVTYALANGGATVESDGSVTYAPASDFSGTEEFVVRTTDGTTTDSAVTATVEPVADAPTLGANRSAATFEDTAVALDLSAPVVTDDGTGAGNDATSERIGVVTLTGLPEGAALLDGAGLPLLTVGTDPVRVVISDVATVNGTSGDLTLTAAQYAALQVRPPEDDAGNFTVTASATSFEVDAAGDRLPDVPGAATTQSVAVSVQAVTDDAALVFDDGVAAASVAGADAIAYSDGAGGAGDTEATVSLQEDTRFDLRGILEASFGDLDGSEGRALVITNGSSDTIRVGGTNVAAGGSITIPATGQTGDEASFPKINIGAGFNFSGTLSGIGITLTAQDADADGFDGGAPGEDGLAEADTADNAITLNLEVAPVAGDVPTGGFDVTTQEDTAADFLSGVRTDDANGFSSEVVESVSFDVPAGWTFAAPPAGTDAPFAVGTSGGTTTITFTGGNRQQRQAVLDEFTLTPPAHSSVDATVTLSITTADGSDTATVTRDVDITVEPVAEVEDGTSDDAAADDLSLTPGVVYDVDGREDEWFDLNSDGTGGAFALADGWSVEDGDETLFALMTPTVEGAESAVGAQFRWVEDGTAVTATFAGAPVRIPVSSLGSAEFLPPPDVSGRFAIEVNALTRDFDDDAEGVGTPDEATSGQAFLENLDVLPVADEIALTLTGRTSGPEDTEIPLSIRPSSSDSGETFDVDIRDIPEGAVVTYDGVPFTATTGNTTLSIAGFDPAAPLTIRPPADSNEDFVLQVDAVTVDAATIGGVQQVSTFTPSATLPIAVAVAGVADPAPGTATAQTYDEAALDAGTDAVALDELVSFALADTDGSEALTLRVSGLPAGFSVSEGALVTPPSATGGARVWALSQAQYDAAVIEVPANFSGTRTFQVEPVTTEDDGNSRTGAPVAVEFTVTPAPEARVSDGATLMEDVVTTLDVRIVHRNGDEDEAIESVRIRQDEAADDGYTLYLGTGTSAQMLSTAGLPTQTEGGVDYYVLTPAEAATLSALTDANVDGAVGEFKLQYRITDDAFGATTGTGPTTDASYRSETFALTATPVTDAPDASITGIGGTAATTATSEETAGDDASPDKVVLGAPDTVTVDVAVASPDDDGSERVTRLVIDNVPQGATVAGAEALGPGSWLLTFDGPSAVQIGPAGASIPVEFVFGTGVPTTAPTRIDITVQVQDRGELPSPGTSVEEDVVSLTVETTYGATAAPEPAEIDQWLYTGAGVTEDVASPLSDLIDAAVTTRSTEPNTFTVQLTDVPPGTVIDGMTRTVIDGVETFTALVETAAGATDAQAQAALDALLAGITLAPPLDSNDNNAPGGLSFTATLNTTVRGGATFETAQADPAVPVEPVTDPAAIAIGLGPSDDDGSLDESDPAVPIRIALANDADGAAADIVTGDLYLQVEGSVPDLQGGTLTSADGTTTYAPTAVTGVPGIPDGTYFVIPGTDFGDVVDVIYTPPSTVAGDVTVTATIVNQETGAPARTDDETALLTVAIGNDGATLASDPSTGAEASGGTTASLIELAGLAATLDDADGSEAFASILLADVPEGFVVYVGADQAGAAPATNAGGDGTVNTWILSGSGEELPAYVAILPPQHYSGTISGISLVATSGETVLDESRSDTVPLGDVTVTPVADGAEVAATSTFGTSGRITPLNLNVALVDAADATTSPAAPDASQETATVTLTGLGEFVAFYAGATPVQITDAVSYDAGTGSYTIEGLTQADLDTLAFRQAKEALTDQDGGAAGTQIGVSVTTTDGADVSDPAATTVTVALFDQIPTADDDVLLTTGFGLDALDGEDRVDLRAGEDLDGVTLDGLLDNVETIDLGLAGANEITGLTADEVAGITDAGNALTVNGTDEDALELSGAWSSTGGGVYTATTAGAQTVTLTVLGDLQDEVEVVA